jgi:hypothetical protein
MPEREKARSRAEKDPEAVRSVYGDPIEHGALKVIPVAAVRRCGRGGENRCGCLFARPVGLVVLEDGKVGWKPAVDPERLLLRTTTALGLCLWLGRRRPRRR